MSSISVVMATYNGELYLKKQIQSVLNELLPGDELIIVDDNSQDRTFEILKSLNTDELRLFQNSTNIGVRATFERGLSLSNKEFIFFCDQDDIWLPGKRAAFVAEFDKDPKVSIVISDAEVIDAQGQLIAPSFMAMRRGFNGSVFATVWRNRYLGCAMALRRTLLVSALPMPRYIPMHDMWFGAIGNMTGKVVYLSNPFLQYRRHANNVSPGSQQSLKKILRGRFFLILYLGIRIFSIRFGFHQKK